MKTETGEVGIFWDYKGNLLCFGLPLDDAQEYGFSKTYPAGHHRVWESLQAAGFIPKDEEYEAFPRGRVVYDTCKGKFTLFLDLCIYDNKDMTRKVVESLHLGTSNTVVAFDEHYVCPGCIRELERED